MHHCRGCDLGVTNAAKKKFYAALAADQAKVIAKRTRWEPDAADRTESLRTKISSVGLSTGFAPFIHMFSTEGRGTIPPSPFEPPVFKRWLCACLVLATTTAAEAATGSTLFRIFLLDGTSLVSFGEFARLDSTVIFSMPVGGTPDQPRLYVVTLPASTVDWARTDRYSQAARVGWYADTRGEVEFQQLSSEVARVLNEIALLPDKERGLEIAEAARKSLADWPNTHYGYRAAEIQEIVALLDESISDLRASLGMSAFDLAFVASPAPAVPLEPLLGGPTMAEQVGQAFRVALLTDRAADRVGLMHAVLGMLAEAGTSIPEREARRWRNEAEDVIRREASTDAAYAALSKRVLASATKSATAANVSGVERSLEDLRTQDDRLGNSRPETVDAVRVSLQEKLDAARRLRLRRDQWVARRALYRDYEKSTSEQVRQLTRLQPALEAIRRLDGPPPSTLSSLRKQLEGGADRLQRIGFGVPDDLRAAHELLVGAWRFAEKAVAARTDAVSSGNLSTAWEASSAAAGALLMLNKAQHDIGELIDPPQLQ
jgi:hypothetical protein